MFLDKVLADRIYSKGRSFNHAPQTCEIVGIEKNLDLEVPHEESCAMTSEMLAGGKCSSVQEPSVNDETDPSTAEPEPLAPDNDFSEHTDNPRQSFDGAVYSLGELFSCRDDRENTIKKHQLSAGGQELRFPDLFRYGIRYEPYAGQTNIFKMVSIMNLPTGTSLNSLMTKVRGGTVVSCRLLDITSITGSFSALVRFLHGHEALAYEEFATTHPIVFHGSRARVTCIKTPSWPLSFPHNKAIFHYHHTRCLEVDDFPRQVPPAQLTRDLGHVTIEYMHMRKDGVLELRFSSIADAGRAYGMLTTFRAYRRCRAIFVKDPCALPLETLVEPAEQGSCKGVEKLSHEMKGEKNLLTCTA